MLKTYPLHKLLLNIFVSLFIYVNYIYFVNKISQFSLISAITFVGSVSKFTALTVLKRPRSCRVTMKIDHIHRVYLTTSDVSLSSVKLRLSDVKFSLIRGLSEQLSILNVLIGGLSFALRTELTLAFKCFAVVMAGDEFMTKLSVENSNLTYHCLVVF